MFRKIIFLCLFTQFILISLFSQTLVIAYENKEQPPYYLGDTNEILDKPGVAVEMIMALEEYIPGLNIELKRLPWTRCLKELELGTVDGIFNASYVEERATFGCYPYENGVVDPSKRITSIAYNFYTLPGVSFSWDGDNVESLFGAVGVPRGYSVIENIKDLGLQVEEADSSLQNLRKLMAGRLNVIALQDVTAEALIYEHPDEFSSIIEIQPPIAVKPYYLLLSNSICSENNELASQIWDALEEIRNNHYSDISKKYR